MKSRKTTPQWRADRQEWDTETVRLDGFIRQNADIDLGEYDEIHKIEPEKADSLTLAPPEETSVQFGSDAVSIVTRQILKHSVVEGDISPVISSTNQPFVRSPGRTIPLIAVATDPTGTCLITEGTEVELVTSETAGSRQKKDDRG